MRVGYVVMVTRSHNLSRISYANLSYDIPVILSVAQSIKNVVWCQCGL